MRLKTTSAQAPWLNRVAIFLGVAILIWMAFENNNVVWTVMFAGCILIVAVAGLFFTGSLPSEDPGGGCRQPVLLPVWRLLPLQSC